ncbi:hypothetical protein RRF57_010266 [Xylaria bambusicola]|uniref:Uncharacterized protein n=1 Tax=Xylaria bambusicola TaxID=326684 RepID=A0AAN7ZCW7_9PEZI
MGRGVKRDGANTTLAKHTTAASDNEQRRLPRLCVRVVRRQFALAALWRKWEVGVVGRGTLDAVASRGAAAAAAA